MKKFGTFGGVFTPTLLTILGVIMYLRLGWVVGNAGLLGAWVIILISFTISICTALSMSSITTNIRIGAGGAYAIISQSLGLEVGGSLGIPRYISQGLAVTLYIFGFREGWLSIFPTHPPFLVDLVVFLLLFAIAYRSANLAIRTQYIIMAIIVVSIISIVLAAYFDSMHIGVDTVLRWGEFPGAPENNFAGTDFWVVFAVFFPASTGIMAGANMSGELKDPRRSIPVGTMWAIGISLIIYMALAYWIARSASVEELVSNYNIMVEKAYWGWAIVAGILGATFSSALASIVGSSRILQAMGEHRVIPAGEWLAKRNAFGEPRNAMIITGLMVFITLLLRDLNAIAPLVTMFFLITYAMLNVVVIIEQRLSLVSFRPLFRVPHFVPWVGLISSVLTMFIINPTVSLISVAVVVGVYLVLSRSHLEAPFEDVRSGLFISFAEWAAKHAWLLPKQQERAWKPNLLVPVKDIRNLRGDFLFLQHLAAPKGSVKLMGIANSEEEQDKFEQSLKMLCDSFLQRGVFASSFTVASEDFAQGVNFGIQTLRGAFFQPNIVFLNMAEWQNPDPIFEKIIAQAKRADLGTLVFAPHPRARLGQRQRINVWIRDRSPNWDIEWDIGNLDLSILIAYKFKINWPAKIRLITVIDSEEEEENARHFMDHLMDLARLPETEVLVQVTSFRDYLPHAPVADLNIFGLWASDPNFDFIREMVEDTGTSCMFVGDSGRENVLA